MNSWNLIYQNTERIAFSAFGINIYWYGIFYAIALLIGLWAVSHFVKVDKYPLSRKNLDSFFLYAELGIILGARLGFILIYDPNRVFYLTHPWEIFNPFINGKFVGISGMSYHGAVVGFILASFIYAKRAKKSFLMLMDCAAVALPLGYIFGRIGNFLNHELIGRQTDLPIGILVGDTLRHPSQLYEAFLEGFVIFMILFFIRRKVRFQGALIGIYMLLYSLARFFVEFFREPDSQMGYFWVLSMGQILSIISLFGAILFLFFAHKLNKPKAQL